MQQRVTREAGSFRRAGEVRQLRGRALAAMLVLVFAAGAATAATLTVRRDGTGDYATIQPALDAAADGDTVLIGPGEYTEFTWVRLPGWGWEIRSYALVRSDNLTLLGAGALSTILGPSTYEGSGGTYSPEAITYQAGGGSLTVGDLTMRHCYTGLSIEGTLHMERCRLENNGAGVAWYPVGSGGWIRDTELEVTEPIFDPIGFDIGSGGLGSDIVMERCRLSHPLTIRGVQNMVIRDCLLNGTNLYAGTSTYVHNCQPSGPECGFSQSLGGGTYCEIRDSNLRTHDYSTLVVDQSAPGGRFVVQNTRLQGGSRPIILQGAGACEISGCDLGIDTGPMVRCEGATVVTHDFRNNYWGTTDEATIQSWIIDHSDDAAIGATVLYSPFAGQSVPAETTTWGDLKAMWR